MLTLYIITKTNVNNNQKKDAMAKELQTEKLMTYISFALVTAMIATYVTREVTKSEFKKDIANLRTENELILKKLNTVYVDLEEEKSIITTRLKAYQDSISKLNADVVYMDSEILDLENQITNLSYQ